MTGFAEFFAPHDRRIFDSAMHDDVRYAPRVGAPVDVKGFFDAAYLKADAGQAGMVSSGPAVFLRLADLPTDPEDDDPLITIDGVVYKKREPQKDGKGGVLIHLYEA